MGHRAAKRPSATKGSTDPPCLRFLLRYRIKRPEAVFRDRISKLGTLGEVTTATLEPHLRAVIQTSIATALGGSDVAFLDLAANQ